MSRFTKNRLAGLIGLAGNLIKSSLMVVGVVALVAWEVQTFTYAKPGTKLDNMAPVLSSIRPAKLASETAAQAEESDIDLSSLGSADEHTRISTFLAKKYQVSQEATKLLVGAAYLAAKETGVEPHLILSVMAIESRFHPFAESPMGAKGLMQVIPKFHMDKFEPLGGQEAVLNPVANIKVGAMILKDYIQRFGGIEAGLKAYSGATGDDFGYPNKVIAERDRLRAAGKGTLRFTPALATPAAPSAPPPKSQVGDKGVLPLTLNEAPVRAEEV